jgi:hypothetical protein
MRLAAARLPHDVGWEDSGQGDEPSLDRKPIIERLYVAADGDHIRGGVWLKEQLYWSQARPVRVGWAKYPVAESLIDGAAAGVPASLLFSLLRQQPYLMALGMGGHTGPFARLLAAMRWASSSIPFFVQFLHPSRVLRQLSYARRSRLRRLAADGLAFSGLAWAANKIVAAARAAVKPKAPRGYAASLVARFDAWADDLWQQGRDSYGFVAVRDSRALNSLYPEGFNRLARLRVRRRNHDVGWICPRSIDAQGTWFERDFGNLKLGIITDAFALPADATGVMDAGLRYLIDDGVDLVVTFLSHPAWCAAAGNVGFLPAPSNCAFYRSPAVEGLIARAAAANRHCHLTYSDGDGPETV